MPVKNLPVYLHGRRFSTNSSRNSYMNLVQRSGDTISVPCLDEAFVKAAYSERSGLASTPLHGIVNFLRNVGKNWKKSDYPRRQNYVSDLCKYLGYSREMAENEANWIALTLCSSHRLFDTISTELGSWNMLDQWVSREEVNLRAYPRGNVLHLLPGNVPISAIISMIRAAVTKNDSIVKYSAGDPFTATTFLQSCIEVDANHPVTKSFSIGYWDKADSIIGPSVAAQADVIIAWGGNEAVAWSQAHASVEAEVIKFGPKRSFGIVGNTADVASAARRAAFDVCIYDQRACFSSRQLFVEAEVFDAFKKELATSMDLLSRLLPKGTTTLDESADQALTLQHNKFMSPDKLVEGNAWSCVEVQDRMVEPHCLGRTIYLQKVQQASDAVKYADKSIQTVGVYPFQLSILVRDALAQKGVTRIVEMGSHNIFRLGGGHDGIFPLHRLVRIVSEESPSSSLIKGMPAEVDQVLILENDEFIDFIP